MIIGLYTLSSRWPDAPPIATATSLPITWAHSMVNASAWVGLTLPGMIELPGSFSGMRSSARPERGPELSKRMSFAILESAAARVFSAPCANTSGSWPPSAANLFFASTKGSLCVRSSHDRATLPANSGCVLRPVPTAVPPIASS